MELEPFSFNPKVQNKLVKTSAYSSGIGWALLFGFIFSDPLLDMLSDGSNDGLAICVSPLFIISMLCFLVGITTGFSARAQIEKNQEAGEEDANNGIKYGFLGIGFVVIAPLLNPILEKFGIHIYTILDFFDFL